jgi:hypothetical protein
MLQKNSSAFCETQALREDFNRDPLPRREGPFAVSTRALLHHFRVNLSGIVEALIDEITIVGFFVFANDFDENPYDHQKQNQRDEQHCEPESQRIDCP